MVITPEDVMGPPEKVIPVPPPETSTDVTVPIAGAEIVTLPVFPETVIPVPALISVTPPEEVAVIVTVPKPFAGLREILDPATNWVT
jgi:hypothetical protein